MDKWTDTTRYATEKAGEATDAYNQQSSAAGENAKQAADKAQEIAYGVCIVHGWVTCHHL